ncbi:mechanosensitive ion channel [Leucothrix sargassi]|nr:mechanosensitive ion channel [Leucothrix sargassi]
MDLDTIIDFEKLQNSVVSNLTEQWSSVITSLPNLMGALLILIVGIIVALIFKKISQTLLRRIGLDRISNKAGVSDVMEDAGMVKRPSVFAGKVIFWMVLFVFLVPAANMLGLTELVNLFKSFISFLPKIITALVILIFGMMFAQFLRRTIMEKPSTIGSNSAKTLGNLVYGIMVTVVVLVALEQLEIETVLLHNIIMLVVGGMMLVLAISVGLGSREVSHNLLTGIYAREQFQQGDVIEIEGVRGVVSEVGALSTLITTENEEQLSIPNSTLYREVVKVSS